MKFLARSVWRLIRRIAMNTLRSEEVNILMLLASVILLIPYWPFAIVSRWLIKEDEMFGDCPDWLRSILGVVDAPRQGILAWNDWIWQGRISQAHVDE